ncbi:MAG: ImmA/IrrE family metallo-endopeptidase [Pyrinomonadaceae bacterium]
MQFLTAKISKLGIEWNKKPLTEEDFYYLCARSGIVVKEMPLVTNGFYYRVLGGNYIAIDSRLEPRKKLFVMFHEFAHFLLHSPDSGVAAGFHGVGKSRNETEADAFALCALIPKPWISTKSAQELIEVEGFTDKMVQERLEVFEKNRI